VFFYIAFTCEKSLIHNQYFLAVLILREEVSFASKMMNALFLNTKRIFLLKDKFNLIINYILTLKQFFKY